MKRLNKKLITLLLAGVCTASLGVATYGVLASADDASTTATALTETKYGLSTIFGESGGATVGAEAVAEKQTAAFSLDDGAYAYFKRTLAYEWKEDTNEDKKGETQYFNMGFAFKQLNFNSVTFTMESEPSVATDEEKTVNKIVFTVKTEGENKVVYAKINDGNEVATAIEAGKYVKLAFDGADSYGAYNVTVGDVTVGEVTGIGAKYTAHSLNEMSPLQIKAEGNTEKTVVYVNEINGQRFDNITTKEATEGTSATYEVTDTAAPVLVVNDEINTLQYGGAFSLDYKVVDVLKTSSLTEKKYYYQYNPTDKEAKVDKELTGSTYFMDTVYYKKGEELSATEKEGFTATSVRKENNGQEYIAVQFKVDDGAKEASYDLAWYANQTVEKSFVNDKGEEVKTTYIVIDEDKNGAYYTYISLPAADAEGEAATKNVVDEAVKEAAEKEYRKALAEATKDISAGSNSSVKLPSADKLIADNGGYGALRFTISYKTPSSSSPKSSTGVKPSSMRLTTSESGTYEFKLFATDAGNNPMQYYLDGELVTVTATNVWDIEEIPSFTFKVGYQGLSVKDPTNATDRRVEKILDETYSISGLTVVGATNQKNDYALYRLDLSGYTGAPITEAALTGVKYETLRTKSIAIIENGGEGFTSYMDIYLDVYAGEIATAIQGDKAQIKACFKEIKAYNANITENDKEWNEYNKFNWNPTAKSFKTAEEGKYLILADFWEEGYYTHRAAAYKLVIVDSKADVIEGESEVSSWVENNKVSVILFGIAGLMLIAIVALLLVKPSDETLDDVDAKAAKKAKKKAAKEKKAKKEKKNKDK